MKTFLLSCLSIIFLSFQVNSQNLLIDGDFEGSNSTGCDFNNTNVEFNAHFSDLTAFGMGGTGDGEICIMQGDCGFGIAPQSGQYKLGLAGPPNQGDAFSFNLSSPITAGQNYDLSFYIDLRANVGDIEIGISNSPTDFGTLVYSATPTAGTLAWDLVSGSFNAPSNADYLTVRVMATSTNSVWIHMDNFSLTSGGAAIPTLGQWGLIILGLGILILGIASFKQRELQLG